MHRRRVLAGATAEELAAPSQRDVNQFQYRRCSIKNCDRRHAAKGFCNTHYRRSQQGIDMSMPIVPVDRVPRGEWRAWHVTPEGYVMRSRIGEDGRDERQLEHRLIMSEALGRDLLPRENVHHVNGVRHDNRLENLELWATSQPSGQRVAEKIEWAKAFLQEYGFSVNRGRGAPRIDPAPSPRS